MPNSISLADRVREILAAEGISVQVLAGGESDSIAVTLIARDWEPVEPATGGSAAASTPSVAAGPTSSEPLPLEWFERPVPGELPARLLHLSDRLTGGCSLSGKERLHLAYTRGKQAAAICRGEIGSFSGDRCDLKNRCYVVLYRDRAERSFFTWNYPTYAAEVFEVDGDFDESTVSHGFASRSEALAFVVGAGFSDLPQSK